MKKILFISHDASRTGAPLVLLNFLKWLNGKDESISIDVLLLSKGPLKNEFKEYCNELFVIHKKDEIKTFRKVLSDKIKSKLGLKINKNDVILNSISKNNYNLIYANTIVSVPYGVALKNKTPNSRLLVHVHELNSNIRIYLPNFLSFTQSIDRIIAVSNQVKLNLINNWNFTEYLIDVVYPFSKLNKLKPLPVAKSKFRVGASGLAYWRKGDDIFIQVANYINRNHSLIDIEFVWVGSNSANKIMLEEELRKLDLVGVVKFVGEQENPFSYFNSFDVFLLPSREDPFPLVCIEIASLKKPIICFEGASGTSEVIKKGGGFVVPYLAIEEMGEKIIYYYNNQEQCVADGEKAYKLFKDYTPEKICPQYFEIIEQTLNK